jgi:hypothetical protein
VSSLQAIDPTKLSDRELLLILHERVFAMTGDVKELKDGFSARLAAVEARMDVLQEHKADKRETDGAFEKITLNNEARTVQINKLTNYVWFAFGALAILQIVLSIVMKFGLPH